MMPFVCTSIIYRCPFSAYGYFNQNFLAWCN